VCVYNFVSLFSDANYHFYLVLLPFLGFVLSLLFPP
jgi:hypothetical protein